MKNFKYDYTTDRFSLTKDEVDFSLLTACLHIGYKCNLSCPYCFNQYDSDKIIQAKNEDLFSAIIKLGVKRLVISGGEPFLYQTTLLSLLKEAKKNNIKTLVSTNGTLINKTIVETFLPYFNYVDVSLPATTKERYIKFRGFDGFAFATNGIKLLLDNGVKTRLTYTVSETNVNDVLSLPDLIKELGVKNVRIGYIYDNDGKIKNAYNLDAVVKRLETAGVATYRPITGKLLRAYNKGYVVLRLNGNTYLSNPSEENFITNIINKDKEELYKIFKKIALNQRTLFCK